MACGLPVVGSANEPVTEVITDGQNGRLVGFNEPDSLVRVMCELLDDPVQAKRLGDAARQTIISRYRFESSAEAYEELILSLKLSATKG
jgi:glycosyltransferase involved in cell wall biosynthesis